MASLIALTACQAPPNQEQAACIGREITERATDLADRCGRNIPTLVSAMEFSFLCPYSHNMYREVTAAMIASRLLVKSTRTVDEMI